MFSNLWTCTTLWGVAVDRNSFFPHSSLFALVAYILFETESLGDQGVREGFAVRTDLCERGAPALSDSTSTAGQTTEPIEVHNLRTHDLTIQHLNNATPRPPPRPPPSPSSRPRHLLAIPRLRLGRLPPSHTAQHTLLPANAVLGPTNLHRQPRRLLCLADHQLGRRETAVYSRRRYVYGLLERGAEELRQPVSGV